MTKYKIHTTHETIEVEVEEEVVKTSGDFFSPYVGQGANVLFEHCRKRGWSVVPVIPPRRPTFIEFSGEQYELVWDGEHRIKRIYRRNNGFLEEITFADLPDPLKNLIH